MKGTVMRFLSSNAFSVDDQARDVIRQLEPDDASKFAAAFPDYNGLTWSGSWVDTEASGVDCEYMSWAVDWIESNTDVIWEDGEPVIWEDGDRAEDDE